MLNVYVHSSAFEENCSSESKSETEGISISEEILENVGSKSKRPSKVTGKNVKPMALTFKPTTQGQRGKTA